MLLASFQIVNEKQKKSAPENKRKKKTKMKQ